MGWDKDRECNCCIRVDDSLVVIVCGEMDAAQLRENYKTYIEINGNNQVVKND
ncbi:MAG TPA: hypothetical protein GX502_07815 [Syntrophaceticus sp.]|nr:hypothetical protein [Syntrophaceticus sp.]